MVLLSKLLIMVIYFIRNSLFLPYKFVFIFFSNLTTTFKVVVVPDSATAKKVPAIPGLLEYRADRKKLYVRANKTWNLLTQEKEVKILT